MLIIATNVILIIKYDYKIYATLIGAMKDKGKILEIKVEHS